MKKLAVRYSGMLVEHESGRMDDGEVVPLFDGARTISVPVAPGVEVELRCRAICGHAPDPGRLRVDSREPTMDEVMDAVEHLYSWLAGYEELNEGAGEEVCHG